MQRLHYIDDPLERAKRMVRSIMGREPRGFPTIAMNYIDWEAGCLAVGFHHHEVQDPYRHEKQLRHLIGDIPVRLFTTIIRRQNTTKKQACRPVWGGVRMTSLSTICLPLTDSDGTLGVIISHHAVGNGTGQSVGQPGSTSKIGSVITNPLMNSTHWRGSDSAFAEKTNKRVDFTENAIWKTATSVYNVVAKISSANTPVGTQTIMQGAMQPDITEGVIYKKGVDINDGVVFLTNQILATYNATSGDSGAPVFRMTGVGDNVELLGIHAGRCDDPPGSGTMYSYYSPWEAIQAELNL